MGPSTAGQGKHSQALPMAQAPAPFLSEESIGNLGLLGQIRLRQPYVPKEDFMSRHAGKLGLLVVVSVLIVCLTFQHEVNAVNALVLAHLGHKDAQYLMGQRYHQGTGVIRNSAKAAKWFRRAADQGHHHAGFNLAMTHVWGHHRTLEKGEALELIQRAAEAGLEEAQYAAKYACSANRCR